MTAALPCDGYDLMEQPTLWWTVHGGSNALHRCRERVRQESWRMRGCTVTVKATEALRSSSSSWTAQVSCRIQLLRSKWSCVALARCPSLFLFQERASAVSEGR